MSLYCKCFEQDISVLNAGTRNRCEACCNLEDGEWFIKKYEHDVDRKVFKGMYEKLKQIGEEK